MMTTKNIWLLFFSFTAYMLSSCSSSNKLVGGYEFTQSVKLNAHWDSYINVNINIDDNSKFSLRIIDGANYGSLPKNDTILIAGSYIERNGKLILTDVSNSLNKFTLVRRKNKIILSGTYFNAKKNSISKIKNINKIN